MKDTRYQRAFISGSASVARSTTLLWRAVDEILSIATSYHNVFSHHGVLLVPLVSCGNVGVASPTALIARYHITAVALLWCAACRMRHDSRCCNRTRCVAAALAFFPVLSAQLQLLWQSIRRSSKFVQVEERSELE